MNKIVTLLLALSISIISSAQVKLVVWDSIPVVRNGEVMQNATSGGFNSPQFSEIDLNGDGMQDLVSFERNFYGSVKTFINTGSSGHPSYRYDPWYRLYFPAMRNWMLLRDYNCDGKADIFTAVPAGIAVYRNDSDGSGLKFTKITSLLFEDGLNGPSPVYVSPPDVPAIEDIDGDGDLDILSFNIVGNAVEYHKNLSMELYGDCSELDFELKNTCWGYFIEDDNTNEVSLFDTCDVNVGDPEKRERHPGSTLLAIDLNGNGVKDLLVGDINYSNLVELTNGGTTTGASMTALDADFPSYDQPVDITMFPAAYSIDADNDGLKDLLVAPNNPNTSENYDNIWFYKNTGTQEIPQFEFQQNDFLYKEIIDVGEGSYPVFFDENGDGLQDVIIGNYGYFESAGNYSSRLMLLRNTGTATDPVFEVVTDDYAGLAKLGFNAIYPAFGDMDGDGDQDMISGDEDGSLHYFRNDGGAGNPADFTLAEAYYFDIDVGQSAKPQVYDVNRDGMPDLLVGERSGTVNYFENTGTAEEAVFSTNPTVEEFGLVDVMPECCTGFSAPFMTTDSVGNSLLYVGSEQGKLYLFNNINGNLEGSFTAVDSLYLYSINLSVSGTDLDDDGEMEFVAGEFAGGISFLEGGDPPSLGVPDQAAIQDRIKIYPNPARNYIYIKTSGSFSDRDFEIRISNLLGKTMINTTIYSGTNGYADIRSLPAGVYLIQVAVDGEFFTRRLIVQ